MTKRTAVYLVLEERLRTKISELSKHRRAVKPAREQARQQSPMGDKLWTSCDGLRPQLWALASKRETTESIADGEKAARKRSWCGIKMRNTKGRQLGTYQIGTGTRRHEPSPAGPSEQNDLGEGFTNEIRKPGQREELDAR